MNPSDLLVISTVGELVGYRYVQARTALDMTTQVNRELAELAVAFPDSRIVSIDISGTGAGGEWITQIGVDAFGTNVETYPLVSDTFASFAEAGEPSTLVAETSRLIVEAGVISAELIGQTIAGAGSGARWMTGLIFALEGTVPPMSGAEDTLLFGANSVLATTTDRFLYPSYSDNNAMTSPVQYRLVRPGTLRNFRMRHNGTNGNGNDIDYTVRINGAPTAITVALASTTVDGSDLVNTVVAAAGDLIDIIVEKALSVGTSPTDIAGSLGFG